MTVFAEEPYQHTEGYFECKETIYESEFSEWHLTSESQLIFESLPEDQYWVYQEGRNFKGATQIRWIQREKPREGFEDYGINAMLKYEDFYAYDYRYLSAGYERLSLQIFIDADGVARHQCVWVKRDSKPPADESPEKETEPNDANN